MAFSSPAHFGRIPAAVAAAMSQLLPKITEKGEEKGKPSFGLFFSSLIPATSHPSKQTPPPPPLHAQSPLLSSVVALLCERCVYYPKNLREHSAEAPPSFLWFPLRRRCGSGSSSLLPFLFPPHLSYIHFTAGRQRNNARGKKSADRK